MTPVDPTPDDSGRDNTSRGLAWKTGFALILLSGVLWFSLFAIPFLALSVGQKAALAGAVFVGVQIAWWTGAALVGPQTLATIKSWRRRRAPKRDEE